METITEYLEVAKHLVKIKPLNAIGEGEIANLFFQHHPKGKGYIFSNKVQDNYETLCRLFEMVRPVPSKEASVSVGTKKIPYWQSKSADGKKVFLYKYGNRMVFIQE